MNAGKISRLSRKCRNLNKGAGRTAKPHGSGMMAEIKRKSDNASRVCPVCGSHRTAIVHRMDAGALPVTRTFYCCGTVVTTNGNPSERMLALGVGCRRDETVNN